MNKLNHSANYRELGSRFPSQKSNRLRVSTVRPPSCFVCWRESMVAKISFAPAYNVMLMSRLPHYDISSLCLCLCRSEDQAIHLSLLFSFFWLPRFLFFLLYLSRWRQLSFLAFWSLLYVTFLYLSSLIPMQHSEPYVITTVV